MRKIDFLAPSEGTGGSNDSEGAGVPPRNNNPEFQLLRELYPGKAVLTVKETSKVLNVSDDFLYTRLNSGDIKGINTGRNWAIPLTEVARLLKKGVK